ncbi:MAG: hypothetical protein BWK78_02285 [Thiotrichaceae bacterium IS1]|nr:MAG: hypothetical protein BWK78_02285 [Thiotrichaceae bacterium IS1]
MVFIALWILLFTTPVWGSVCVVEIVKIHGDTKWFQITKSEGSKLDKFTVTTFLEPGYKIQVLQPRPGEDRFEGKLGGEEYSITLLLANGEYKTLKYADTHGKLYQIECSDTPPPPSVPQNVLDSAQKTFDKLRLKTLSWFETLIQGKEEKKEEKTLFMPLFTSAEAKLVSSKTTVYLGWKGGNLPYIVQIFENCKEIVKLTNIKQRNAELAGEKFMEGHHYTIVVSETNNPDHKATGTLTVVNKSALPTEVADIEKSNLLPQSKRTLQATWLVNRDEKIWSFEAYQQAVEILRDYPQHYPAELLKQSLKEEWNK